MRWLLSVLLSVWLVVGCTYVQVKDVEIMAGCERGTL